MASELRARLLHASDVDCLSEISLSSDAITWAPHNMYIIICLYYIIYMNYDKRVHMFYRKCTHRPQSGTVSGVAKCACSYSVSNRDTQRQTETSRDTQRHRDLIQACMTLIIAEATCTPGQPAPWGDLHPWATCTHE